MQKLFIIIYIIILLIIISFIYGLTFCPQCQNYSIKEECKTYVYYKNEKLYIPEKVKEYIEQLQFKGEDRMKSKRGIFSQ